MKEKQIRFAVKTAQDPRSWEKARALDHRRKEEHQRKTRPAATTPQDAPVPGADKRFRKRKRFRKTGKKSPEYWGRRYGLIMKYPREKVNSPAKSLVNTIKQYKKVCAVSR
ncbi:hypothetical protein [Dysosmobacter sp. Sow4_B12]|uniref:hypothetical protein n=1 Tax=Dysosmobacter sp. Sow4_B12 TaxID=3438777 RepID=UPI003F8F9CF9